MMNDIDFMLRAIENAKRGSGWTNPNPLVGAVIAKDGKIIAEGYHHKCGDLHAERDALKNAKENNVDVTGATMYVTLEPCCHTGRQPPCTQAIIGSGIKKVVIGSRDPNPLVNGGGVKVLLDAGIEVEQDFLKEECDALNPIFFHYIKTKTPYVILKYAMTMDGETATSKGESKWITGEKAREDVHRTRSKVMAVMCGISTVLKDDPMLNVRLEGNYRQPERIVLDSSLKIPLDCSLVKTSGKDGNGMTSVFCSAKKTENDQLKEKIRLLEKMNVRIEKVSEDENGMISLSEVMKKLGEKGIDSVLVESGGKLSASMIFSPFVQEVHAYIAPKVFGNDGTNIFTPVRGTGVDLPKDAIEFSIAETKTFGDDVLLKFRRK